MTRHSGKSNIKVSLQHDKKELLVQAIKLVSKTLCRFYLIAEQWSIEQRWTLLLTHIFRHWLGGKWLGALPEGAPALLSRSIKPAEALNPNAQTPPPAPKTRRIQHQFR